MVRKTARIALIVEENKLRCVDWKARRVDIGYISIDGSQKSP